jgi:hypothetical protein
LAASTSPGSFYKPVWSTSFASMSLPELEKIGVHEVGARTSLSFRVKK